MTELDREEQDFYDNCVEIYRLLTGTKLGEYLNKQREKVIHKIAHSNNDRETWINIGALRTIDDLTDKKISSRNEIKRIDELKDDIGT